MRISQTLDANGIHDGVRPWLDVHRAAAALATTWKNQSRHRNR